MYYYLQFLSNEKVLYSLTQLFRNLLELFPLVWFIDSACVLFSLRQTYLILSSQNSNKEYTRKISYVTLTNYDSTSFETLDFLPLSTTFSILRLIEKFNNEFEILFVEKITI